jgi:16S rRNA (guanine966-N2)-methyltransferase
MSYEGRSNMKISSGWSKGLKILTPEGLDTRPTRQRIRQSAINMLAPWISGARVLDLFAGSGAVGLELVSRGATGAVFVEVAKPALDCLRRNVSEFKQRADKEQLSISPWAVEAKDAYELINAFEASSFDLIWADPPYQSAKSFMQQSGPAIAKILSSGGVFSLESSHQDVAWLENWGEAFHLALKKQRSYGVTLISIWQKA